MNKILTKTFVIITSTIFLISISAENFYAMQIFVKLITGENITLEVESSDTVEAVKGKIEEKEGIPARIQRLVFGGNELQEGRTLADYDVKPGDTILLFPVNIGSIKFFVTNMTAE